MRMRCWLVAMVLAVAAGEVVATEPRDFAYSMELDAEGAAGLYRLTVPAEVYRHVVSPRLRDLRVFNHSGEAVPHALRAQPVAHPDPPTTRRVPYFPLPEATGDDGGLNVTVNTDDAGSIISIQRSDGDAAVREVKAYLVDLSGVAESVQSLRLSVAPVGGAAPERLDARVTVTGSDDLADWQHISDQIPLVRLRYQGHRLERSTVPLPANAGPYLRISWSAAARGYQLDGVTAVIRQEARTEPLIWQEPAAVMGEEAGEYLFDSGGRFPVQALEVVPGYDNAFLQVQVASRPERTSPWRQRLAGNAYRLELDGVTLRSDAVDLALVRDRYWRLRVMSGPTGGPMPRLRLARRPEQLYFVAQGPGPYRLAFGSAEAASAESSTGTDDALLRLVDERPVTVTRAGVLQELGGQERLAPDPEAVPWARFALWGVLLAAVAVLGGLAWRLYRQMNANDDEPAHGGDTAAR